MGWRPLNGTASGLGEDGPHPGQGARRNSHRSFPSSSRRNPARVVLTYLRPRATRTCPARASAGSRRSALVFKSSSKATTHAVRRAALSTVESLETRRLMAHVPELVDATPENFEQWGQFTAAKGNFVLVGNSVQMVNSLANVGEVTLFDTSDADPVAGAVTIANPDPDANDGFGAAVAFIGSDKIAISSFEPNNAGKVFIYDLQGTKLHEINSPFGPSSTWGTQLASWENGTDDYLLVGGPIDGTTESNGSIRVFNADTGAYTG